MRVLGILWRSTAARSRSIAAALAANPQGVVFTAALLMASVGFGMAWLPLGFIVPGCIVCGLMVAWRWQMAFRKRDEDA